MLDSNTITTVKATVPLLEQAGTAITEHFYKRMFKHNPELLNIFNESHQHTGEQPKALFNAVLAYAKFIDKPEVLSGAIEHIAQKHTGFLIQPEHYTIVGNHLLATLKELAPDVVTDEVLAAWTKAYQVLAGIFIERESTIYSEYQQAEGGWKGPREFTVLEKNVESDLITSFKFAPVDGKPVKSFKPGQYLSLVTNPNSSVHQEIRQYSLSDKPNGKTYRISVRRESRGVKPGIVSNYLHNQINVGDTLKILPPAGDFYLQAKQETPVVLISAGVGLTPMVSMLNTLVANKHQAPIYYLHACEHSLVHAFKPFIKQVEAENKNVQSLTWYRQPTSIDQQGIDYQFEGTMQIDDIKQQVLLPNAQYYLCGPFGFMQTINQQLLSAGVDPSQIHYEVFGPQHTL
ncbi:NO-inducible flavohemoprotein [Endozoicomonas sp. SM1973]|uniref:Flavohemoprotein n=1 Tax=Spartinivicinus marinus TaxID=2994442 RepID=A0A853I5W4_9GAMM|nr:NO-inducible flavohemoprotein [Spartinivicinus marinus]MCX4026781.1 NO-inducible flavohemoprotein [Spartinivicinus marinus]NYZ64615.1 NO-inducible flavohemoprotein [Spartinivicinus marinus]